MKTSFNGFCNLTQIALITTALAGATNSIAADLSLDINDSTQPANTQSGFNALVTPGGTFTNLTETYGAITVTISSAGEPLQSAVRSTPVNGAHLTDAALYQDFIYGGVTNGNGLNILLSGLTPGEDYTVSIWSYDSGSPGAHVSDWTANGALVENKFSFDGSVSPSAGKESAFTFTVASSLQGSILITGLHDSSQATGAAVFLNALQVTASGTPTVSSPHTSSWLTAYSGKYARVYTNNAMQSAGTTLTTWNNGSQNQASPAYAGVQEIYSSSNWLYIRSSGLASFIMGPWQNGTFPNLPANQKVFWRFPRTNTVPATKTLTPGGAIGYFVDGVAMFDSRDAFYWNGTADTSGTGNWNRDAYVNEGPTFDPGYAHQQNTGTYHYHANPIALRYQLGDHVDYNSTADTYSESTNAVLRHSPLLGFVADGFPVYGPYGFSTASNSASGIRRMISGFVPRDGNYGTMNLTNTGRSSIPQWAVRLYGVASNSMAGPAVSSSYPFGRYMEDNDYIGDLSVTNLPYDLDVYNGRWCVTPEFPGGTYAYFVSISSTGTPVFPYNIGRAYYGSPTGATVSTLAETVTTNFLGGPSIHETLASPAISGNNVVLTWSAIEGGTYQVQAAGSLSGSSWVSLKTNTLSGSATGTATDTNGAGYSMRFYRTVRTALATYDPVNPTATTGGGSFSAPGGTVSRGNGTNITITITLPTNPPQPPAGNIPTSITMGSITGAFVSKPSQGTVVASFNITTNATLGSQNITVTFNPAPTYNMTGAFTINP